MQYFNLHTHEYTNTPYIKELVNKYPTDLVDETSFFSTGIHPWFIVEEEIEAHLKNIETKLYSKNCLAIGECGLDKNCKTDLELQKKVFEMQLILAQQQNKPVVIHCVKSVQEIIEIKKKLNCTVPLIIHGFSKNTQLAQSLIDNGFYLSFGKHLLYNTHLQAVFTSIPNNRFFLETDIHLESIETIYEKASLHKKITLNELHQIISDNFAAVFHQKLN